MIQAAAPPQTDAALDAMWTLYAAGKLPELRKAIQERQTVEPGMEASGRSDGPA